MRNGEHHYQAQLIWDGSGSEGTSRYAAYGRDYRIAVDGKPVVNGSADAAFRGDPAKLNPEDLFLAAIASCHMLSYLALCAREGLRVIAYEDAARAMMKEDGKGGGRFEEVVLHPRVTIVDGERESRALELHHRAHELCFVASSCSVPIRHEATVLVSEEVRA